MTAKPLQREPARRRFSPVAAYNWQLSVRSISYPSEDILNARAPDYYFGINNFPVKKMRQTGVPINTTILPGCKYAEAQDFGLQLRPNAHTIDAVQGEIEALLDGAIFSYQLATETSPGELMAVPLSLVLDVDALVAATRRKCLEFFHI